MESKIKGQHCKGPFIDYNRLVLANFLDLKKALYLKFTGIVNSLGTGKSHMVDELFTSMEIIKGIHACHFLNHF